MKKTLLSMALVLFAGVASAQTLTKVWESTHDLNSIFAAGFGEKIYTQTTDSTLYVIDAEGKKVLATEIGGGWACLADEAGNILVNVADGTLSGEWHIYPAAGGDAKKLTITLPTDVTDGYTRDNCCVTGDLLSAEGGVLYATPTGSAGAAKIVIKEGTQDVDASTAIFSLPSDATAAQKWNHETTIVWTGEQLLWRHRSNGFYTWADNAVKSLTLPTTKVNNMGLGYFKLQGVEYVVIPTDAYKRDGFSVCTLADGKVVEGAVRAAVETADGEYRETLTARKVSETKAVIYLYRKASRAAVYTFEVPAGGTTALENAEAEQVKVRKVIENGQLIIIKDGVRYNALGAIVK